MSQKSVLIVGVGGQGTLLASRLLGNVAIRRGYDVKVSEVHGMSQRGGSVVTYVRYSDEKVCSPIIDEGEADVIIAFELLEAYRSIRYLKKGGKLLVNNRSIDPMPVITGAANYPEDILGKLAALGVSLIQFDALTAATEAGSQKAVNTALIGLFASHSEIPRTDWDEALRASVPEKLLNVNQKAFDIGFDFGKTSVSDQ